METQMWFYVGLMTLLVIGNAAQFGKVKRDFVNWIQIIIYAGTILWFVIMIFKGLSLYFYFATTLLFWFALLLEIWQLAKKQEKKTALDTVFVLLTAIAPILSTGLLAGLL